MTPEQIKAMLAPTHRADMRAKLLPGMEGPIQSLLTALFDLVDALERERDQWRCDAEGNRLKGESQMRLRSEITALKHEIDGLKRQVEHEKRYGQKRKRAKTAQWDLLVAQRDEARAECDALYERATRADAQAGLIWKAGERLLESLGEYVRQSMHANPEWRGGVAAMQEALAEGRQSRGRLAHAVLWCADMLERGAERPEEWSGPAQAVFEAVRQWRKL